ncbi:N-formylglutamate amidohydrolase [Bizionia sediminis]|uniref:N-formylglutamate amidohydrolase n=1 Tax=Bizionia sediminis TaxID=1737064 RepID=A0ABW5KW89_9FLAO
MSLLVTCEHGGNFIPAAYKYLFEGHEAILNTHRGWDIGALDVYHSLKPAAVFSAHSTTSRLLVELNRSVHHIQLFSEYTQKLSQSEKQQLLQTYYTPYRSAVIRKIETLVSLQQTVLHVAVHSFTPVWNGVERPVDIGLLFDSRNATERQVCNFFKKELEKMVPYRIRFNKPYLGKSDGFPTFLRKQFPGNYIGIELEINQKFAANNTMPNNLKKALIQAVSATERQLYALL